MSVFTQVRVFKAFPTQFPTDLFVGKPLAKELGRCLPIFRRESKKQKSNTCVLLQVRTEHLSSIIHKPDPIVHGAHIACSGRSKLIYIYTCKSTAINCYRRCLLAAFFPASKELVEAERRPIFETNTPVFNPKPRASNRYTGALRAMSKLVH